MGTTITTATTNISTIMIKTTKASSTTLKSSVTMTGAVPKKQKCEAKKVYLDGTGWLELTRKVLPHKPNMKTVINIEFATRQKNSLLLWQGNFEERHYFALAIVNGFLEFRFSTGSQPVVIRSRVRVNTKKAVKIT